MRGAVALGADRAKGKVQATAGFAFTPDHRRWGEFHARLSRDAAAGIERDAARSATSRSCWSRAATGRGAAGPLQEQAIIAALRDATAMSVEARDAAGVRFADPYLLDGAPTAIDAAAARCALRGAGKIQLIAPR